ncbi:hypothetical protein [Flavobacterium sp. 102]|uniref:hypothetical protein n=1 Tax=Flavobacterium sp. 102 TaxID=2135623 RepID=UPI000EB3270E|nr:hypothetical protein [Flavobacterium sp. 102]RKS03064.1 hypothetical protein C8C84_2805 [Flavobacterium sp. 102]
MKEIITIIESIDSNIPNINPTQIYNEGWMTRLLITLSIKEKAKLNGFDFGKIPNWTSEALVSSPFIKASTKREGYTHADIVFGDFTIDYSISGKINVNQDAQIFGIIEAKMGSSLSKGTSNVKEYNQASRSLACISSQPYDNNSNIFFIVVAPENKIAKIKEQITLEKLIKQIENRFSDYHDDFKITQNMNSIISKAKQCKVLAWSYEEWIEAIANPDTKQFLTDFYEKTKKWNRV